MILFPKFNKDRKIRKALYFREKHSVQIEFLLTTCNPYTVAINHIELNGVDQQWEQRNPYANSQTISNFLAYTPISTKMKAKVLHFLDCFHTLLLIDRLIVWFSCSYRFGVSRLFLLSLIKNNLDFHIAKNKYFQYSKTCENISHEILAFPLKIHWFGLAISGNHCRALV